MSEALKKALASKNKFDELNEKGYVRISAKTPAAKALEVGQIENDAQKLKAAFKRGDDVIGRIKGGGKLGALAALGVAGSQMLGGEKVEASELIKAGAEALNPLPFGVDEIKEEVQKMDPAKMVYRLQKQKEAQKQSRENKALKGALEFGEYLRLKQR